MSILVLTAIIFRSRCCIAYGIVCDTNNVYLRRQDATRRNPLRQTDKKELHKNNLQNLEKKLG